MLELTLDLKLTIIGPFNTKGIASGQYGVDAVLLRNQLGHPVLPGSQVRGRLRDALEEIESAVDDPQLEVQIRNWFGPAVSLALEEDDFVSAIHESRLRRHAWFFSDFTATAEEAGKEENSQQRLLTRIAIDSDTGAVKDQALLVTETAVAAGMSLEFDGQVCVSGSTIDELLTTVHRLYRGLCWIPSFGSFRTVGFGQLEGVSLTIASLVCWDTAVDAAAAKRSVRKLLTDLQGDTTSPASAGSATGASAVAVSSVPPVTVDAFLLRLKLHDSFCLGGIKRSRNLVETEKHISGSVLKGAVAFQIQRVLGLEPRSDLAGHANGRWGKLCQHFASIRFLSAFPVKRGHLVRPVRTPLSLVQGAADKSCRDVALCDGPFLFRNGANLEAPEFRIDWKGDKTPGFDSGWADPPVEPRIHTAIDPKQRRVRTKYLFVQELVRTDQHDWLGGVDLSCVPSVDLVDVRQQLLDVLHRATLRMGKTKARCTVELESLAAPVSVAATGPWVVTLQSQAMMADPDVIRSQWSTSNIDPLQGQYADYWREVSGENLELVRFFADQSLQGGMLARRSQTNSYDPYFVTEPGSVFVLSAVVGKESAAGDCIGKWLKSGLPLPRWACDRHGENYQSNPFLPQDGFGEIVVNHECHFELKPAVTEIEVLA